MYDNNKSKLLHRMLPKTRACVKGFDDQTKWMYLLLEDDDLLEKYNTVWDKVCTETNYMFFFMKDDQLFKKKNNLQITNKINNSNKRRI